ncbi:hypothetical protein [Streptomyces deccanensis]|uniref:hypothetical protein n=1 Tax=Streptomyces deccanensis TaxID=424188 RepID=UPI001EFB7709|nr:hypothetical protein [Streptomyces deccanensis]ULR50802.1 hypothetical protein L3078_16655 [Streptomyces deccanensis]
MRGLLALAGALALTFVTATSASAHYVYAADEVWSNTDSSKCLYTRSEVSHGANGGGYVQSRGLASDDYGIPTTCIWSWNRLPGNLATKWSYYKKTSSGWSLCRSIGWKYNTSTTNVLRASKTYPIYPPCGGGYYATKAWSKVYYSGSWHGAYSIWSGSHYIEP